MAVRVDLFDLVAAWLAPVGSEVGYALDLRTGDVSVRMAECDPEDDGARFARPTMVSVPALERETRAQLFEELGLTPRPASELFRWARADARHHDALVRTARGLAKAWLETHGVADATLHARPRLTMAELSFGDEDDEG